MAMHKMLDVRTKTHNSGQCLNRSYRGLCCSRPLGTAHWQIINNTGLLDEDSPEDSSGRTLIWDRMHTQAGGANPCPALDFEGGFNKFLAAAFGLPAGTSIEDKWGVAFDPFGSDAAFTLCVATLEELGATGNKVRIGMPADESSSQQIMLLNLLESLQSLHVAACLAGWLCPRPHVPSRP